MPRWLRFLLIVLLVALVLFLLGCERPFVEPAAPTVELAEEIDLSIIRSEPELPLALRASAAVGDVSRVELNGLPADFDSSQGLYLATLELTRGLNRIVVEAFGDGGSVGGDTLFALYVPAQFASLAQEDLLDPVGGHTATLLNDGRVLITGGAPSVASAARTDALAFDPRTFTFAPLASRLSAARVGHAAARLPDGRVLITGGSVRVEPEAVDDLVTAVELYDPSTGTFLRVDVVENDGGDPAPVQRAYHTMTILEGANDRVAVYLYGGIGAIGGAESSVLAQLPFVRQFWFEDDTDGPRLVAPNASEGFRFTPIARHTQTPLADVGPDGFGRYLVAGLTEPEASGTPAPFEFVFASSSLDEVPVGPLRVPRTDHAAALFQPGLTLIAGGRTPEGRALSSGELFADEAGVFFRFADDTRLAVARWGHSATNLDGDRILIVGGFSASGQATSRVELFLGTP